VGAAPFTGTYPAGTILMIEAKADGFAATLRAIKVGDEPTSVVVKLLPR
jgi:hypothetical protein